MNRLRRTLNFIARPPSFTVSPGYDLTNSCEELTFVTSRVTAFLKRCRDNHHVSLFLGTIARPLHSACLGLATQIQRRVHSDSAAIRLPNGQTMRIARGCGRWIAT